jgi:two-component system sensor histidine kinase CiaH
MFKKLRNKFLVINLVTISVMMIITLKKHQNNILISIVNTGKGIPQECTDEIFDRFYRIEKSRSRNNGGYGLGLAIAKAIVE